MTTILIPTFVLGPPNMPLQNPSMFPVQDEENLCNYFILLILFFN